MSVEWMLFLLAMAALAGTGFGYFLRWIISLGQKGSMELEIKQMKLDAKEKVQKVLDVAEKEAERIIKEKTHSLDEKKNELKSTERRFIKKEELLDKRQVDIDTDVEGLKAKAEEIRAIKVRADELLKNREKKLENVSGLTENEAKEELLEIIEKEHADTLVTRIQKLDIAGAEQMEDKARDILMTAIHRVGNAMPTDAISTKVKLPNEEIKGKIIGKEGRNIKAFEQASGVDVIVDDTPGMITLSSFDPIRRQIARVALENLIIDGRIQPAKIEETVEKAKDEIAKITKKKGEEAAFELGITTLDPRILAIVGRLHFRTSYGQNVLAHSVEMGHLAGMIAAEVGADVMVAKAAALVHDIGKALTHEVAGTHVEIGRRILQKYGADERIIQAMQSHHEEYPYETTESYIVQVADSISGGRPGARSDSVENYIKRLEELEAIANKHDAVNKSYAIQAGRELRIFVTPSKITDLEAHKMAKDIAEQIEKELQYPGEIKVNVIRESRAIEYAK